MLRLSAVLSGRSLSFLKTSVIYLFSVSLMSCHGLERKPDVADEDGMFLLKRTPTALRLLALSRVGPKSGRVARSRAGDAAVVPSQIQNHI